ncbi:hypothetical protein NRA63_13850 [Acinetobacter baumannii]|nr:hypothetical protein [Acinetobacter baumannii]MDO7464437.1 hypothetical protein [Acinetobacter baumannii]
MFLVKSCHYKDNVLNSKTIKIGTLIEYRKIESQQIVDQEEGFYNLSIDIEKKALSVDTFNLLSSAEHALIKLKCSFKIRGIEPLFNYTVVDFKAVSNIESLNRFIFCISKLVKHEDSTTLFKDYDSYWFLDFSDKKAFIKSLEKSLFLEVKKLIDNGEKVFNKENINIKKLRIKSYFQEIIYTDREFKINNENLRFIKSDLPEIFKNVKFIKPSRFEKEQELRIIFDFYEGNELLAPIKKFIIIPFQDLSYIQK